MAQPYLVLIDHTTGKITVVGGDPAARQGLAAMLVGQSQAVKSAALGAPPARGAAA